MRESRGRRDAVSGRSGDAELTGFAMLMTRALARCACFLDHRASTTQGGRRRRGREQTGEEEERASKRHSLGPAIRDVATAQSKWDGGSVQRITWNTEGAVPRVSVNLFRIEGLDRNGIERLRRATTADELDYFAVDNTGALDYTVPIGLTPGPAYRIKVESTNNTARSSPSTALPRHRA